MNDPNLTKATNLNKGDVMKEFDFYTKIDDSVSSTRNTWCYQEIRQYELSGQIESFKVTINKDISDHLSFTSVAVFSKNGWIDITEHQLAMYDIGYLHQLSAGENQDRVQEVVEKMFNIAVKFFVNVLTQGAFNG
jgi:hypothetical protein